MKNCKNSILVTTKGNECLQVQMFITKREANSMETKLRNNSKSGEDYAIYPCHIPDEYKDECILCHKGKSNG